MLAAWPYVLVPLIGAAIGWTTNWLAIKMLFRPRRELRILGLRICGLIPKRRTELTERVGEIVATELIGNEDLRKVIQTVDLETPILQLVGQRVDEFLANWVGRLPGLARRLIPRDWLDGIKRTVVTEVARTLPRMIDEIIDAISAEVDFKRIVIAKLEAVEVEEFESLVHRLAKKELRAIELAGAVLGFLIGIVQSLSFWLLS